MIQQPFKGPGQSLGTNNIGYNKVNPTCNIKEANRSIHRGEETARANNLKAGRNMAHSERAEILPCRDENVLLHYSQAIPCESNQHFPAPPKSVALGVNIISRTTTTKFMTK